jgi:hypothetical protein
MTSNSSLYGSTPQTGNINSSNLTTLYSGNQIPVPNGNLVIPGTLTVNGCAILTNCDSFSLLPTNAESILFGGAATTMSIGSGSGVTTIQNQLATANYTFPVADGANGQVLVTDGSGTLSFAAVTTVGKTYNIDATATTGGANFNLNSDIPTTDTVKFANGTNMSIVRTDANTITFNATDTNTTYTIASASTTGGANLTLTGSDSSTDSVAYLGSGATTVTSTDANTITISSTDTNTTYTQNASSTTGGANLNLVGSDATTDTVKFASGTGITVTRTDADTITITNSDPGTAGVTSITGTTNQVIASSPTGAVTLSLPQDIATTSNPVFAGVTGGNVTVGVVENNTVATTTGNLIIGDATQTTYYPVINSAASVPVVVQRFTTGTTGQVRSLAINVQSTGTPTVGFGNSIDFQLETAPANTEQAGYVSVVSTDLTAGSEDFRMNFGLMQNGAAYANRLSLFSNGDLNMFDGGKFTIQGATNGYSQFGAPATGSNLTYVLPGAAGAANTVLTNDGSGNLSWALPGGGGSTFGNITIAVATDNTISTTSGDLVLASATNIIDATTATINAATLTVDSRSSIDTTTLTTTSTSTVSLVETTRNVMKNVIYIVQGANVHTVEALVLRVNATTALLTTYAEMYNTSALATFTADVSAGSLRLLVTPTSATSTVFSVVRTSLD